MQNTRHCDYTRPDVEHWWVCPSGGPGQQSEASEAECSDPQPVGA